MNILVACEESQAVTIELRKLGYKAYSCDIAVCSGDHPEWHILGDVLPILNGNCTFETMDGTEHKIDCQWDMLIAFPPCTYLARSKACNLARRDGSIKDYDRLIKGVKAKDFFMTMLDSQCNYIAVENPMPQSRFCLPRYDQIIQPYEYGNPYTKATCLWLKNLPPLFATELISSSSTAFEHRHKSWTDMHSGAWRRSHKRSKTFPGIAQAMAYQWTKFIRLEKAAQPAQQSIFVNIHSS